MRSRWTWRANWSGRSTPALVDVDVGVRVGSDTGSRSVVVGVV